MIDTNSALTYITRAEMADILKCSVANVNTMVHDKRINLPELKMARKTQCGGRAISIYPRELFMILVEKGLSTKKEKRVKAKKISARITFQQVLSGAFSSQHDKDRYILRRMVARTGNPQTKTVSLSGIWK
jgi:hypothetical protein